MRVLSYDLSNSFFSMKARGMEAMLDLVVFEFLYCAIVYSCSYSDTLLMVWLGELKFKFRLLTDRIMQVILQVFL